jgi:hypothetical protein
MDVRKDWYWEGNVVKMIVRFLSAENWEIVSMADAFLKQRGPDIHPRKGRKKLLVEAKGYPATFYSDPKRVGEKKKTKPRPQARLWYSHALLKAVELQSRNPGTVIVLGVPDFPRYRCIFEETQDALEKLGIGFLAVTKAGGVEVWAGPPFRARRPVRQHDGQ